MGGRWVDNFGDWGGGRVVRGAGKKREKGEKGGEIEKKGEEGKGAKGGVKGRSEYLYKRDRCSQSLA